MRIFATANQRSDAIRLSAVAFGVVVGLVAVSPAASAAPRPEPARSPVTTRIRVDPRRVWTSTGVALHKGETATITAAGRTHFGAPPIDRMSPSGIPRGRECAAANALQETHGSHFPAPDLSCWSLIGRIGSAPPFEIGSVRTVHATTSGELFVGVNDDYLVDNSGGWIVTVRASTASTTGPAAAPPGRASSGSSSSAWILVAAGAAAVVALVALALLWSRRRSRHAGQPQQLPEAATAASVERPDSGAVGVEGEVTAGNILAVAFSGPRSMDVAYNHFPEQTVVHWRITQDGAVVTGEFATDGRTETPRLATVPLETDITAKGGPADVTFTWMIGGVAFNYAVRRNPER